MTNQQILKKAIQKAIDGGWKPDDETTGKFHISNWQHPSMHDNPIVEYAIWFEVPGSFSGHIYHVNDIIFNHDFAKALWGIGRMPKTGKSKGDMERTTFNGEDWALPMYLWHLQRMVIAEDPIEYLERTYESR